MWYLCVFAYACVCAHALVKEVSIRNPRRGKYLVDIKARPVSMCFDQGQFARSRVNFEAVEASHVGFQLYDCWA